MNFVKLIGVKRLTFLATLLGITVFFGFTYLVVFNPMLNNSRSELGKVKGQISSFRGKINSVKADIKYMKENIPRYDKVLSQGMFDDQDRFDVERLIEKMKTKAHGVEFSYDISDLEELDSEKADLMGYRLIKRSIALNSVKAMLDSDILSFFQSIKTVFPLYNQIKGFELSRKSRVNYSVLTDIADQKKDSMVTAKLDFDWVTLSEKLPEDETKTKGRGRRR